MRRFRRNPRTRAMTTVGSILVLASCCTIGAWADRTVGFNEDNPQTTVTHFTNAMSIQMTKVSIKNSYTNNSGDTVLSDTVSYPARLYWDDNLYGNDNYTAGTDTSTTGHVNWTDRNMLHNGANLRFKVSLTMKDSGGTNHDIDSSEIARSCE